MSKRLFILITLLAFILAGCAQSEQIQPTVTPTQEIVAETMQPTATSRPARCIAESRDVTPDPTMEAILPPVSSDDWVQGPESAYITVIEYGDFQ